MLVDDVAAVWAEIEADLDERKLPSYPGIPPGHVSLAWPDDEWRAFLDTAVAAGARLVYVSVSAWGREGIDALVAELRDDDDALSDTARAAIAEAEGHVGERDEVVVCWVVEGVRHVLRLVASWREVVEEAAAVADMMVSVTGQLARAASDAEWQRLEASEGAWVRAIAEDARFWRARNEHERRTAAAEVVADLAGCLSDRTHRDRYSWALDVVRKATTAMHDEVHPRIVEQLRENLPELASELRQHREFAISQTRRDREALARRFLAKKAGFQVPELITALVGFAGPPS